MTRTSTAPRRRRSWICSGKNRADAERTAAAAENARILALNTTETKRQRESLLSEQARLTKQITDPDPANPPTAEEQRRAQERLPQIGHELHALDRGDTQRGFQRDREEITAATGRGPGAQITSINRRLELNQREQKDNEGNENDPDREQQLQTEAVELLKTRKEIAFTYAEELTAAQATTRAMAEQMAGQTAAAKASETRAGWEAKIARAINEGKLDLAEQYRLQEKIATIPTDAAAFRASQNHAAQAADQRKQHRDEMDALKGRDGGRTHDATRDGGSATDSQGPNTAIPYAGLPGGTSAVSSFDNVDLPDNPNLPDNATIPDNKGMNFDDIGKHPEMPVPQIPRDANGPAAMDTSGLEPLFAQLLQGIINATTG